jgi:hypothetical protein
MTKCHTLRDFKLPLAEMARKPNPSAVEKGLQNYINLLKCDERVAAQYMEGGSLADLAAYGLRNTAVAGYVMNMLLSDQFRLLATRHEGNAFPKDCMLYVSIAVANFESTKNTFSSNMRVYEHNQSSGHTKRTGTEWTGHGANFDVAITMEFRPVAMTANDPRVLKYAFEQRVVIEPNREVRYALSPDSFPTPPAKEFAVGAVVNLLHDNKQLTEAELHQMAPLDERDRVFPRHNPAVQQIEAALEQLNPFVDMIVNFLATMAPFRAAYSRHSEVAMPWGPARHEIKATAAEGAAGADDAGTSPLKKEISDGDAAMGDSGNGDEVSCIGSKLGCALDLFHRDQCAEMMMGMGVLGDLMQHLLLLKAYATHFGNGYASIDHYMVRSFMKGIGDHNALLFEKRQPLDPLLNKVAMFQARRAGIQLTTAEIDTTGCNVEVQVMLPGNTFFEPLLGIPVVEPDFEGELYFGLGSKPVPVVGEFTRHVFVLPTESDGGKNEKPRLQVKADAEYKNTPVVVVIGTADGKCTNAKAVFLLVDTWSMRLAIKVGAIPSNRAFAKAMSMLPPEMADFAAAIRACDIAEGGLDLHVIYLRPLLASALGIDEVDLMGDPDWMTQLVSLMNGGVSLQSIAQGQNRNRNQRPRPSDADDWQDVAHLPKYNLAVMKETTAKLLKEMLAQGAIDHSPTKAPLTPPVADDDDDDDGNDDGDGPAYRSLGAGVVAPQPAPVAAAPTAVAVAAGGEPGGDDALVDALADGLHELASDDRNFLSTLLKHSEKTIANSEAVLGATLTIPNCATNCHFAKGKVPDGKTTSDFVAPGPYDQWKARPNLDASSKTIRRMLTAHAALGKPVPTTRLAVFGVLVEWESGMITGLMSGSVDPTKTIFEAIKQIAKLQQ